MGLFSVRIFFFIYKIFQIIRFSIDTISKMKVIFLLNVDTKKNQCIFTRLNKKKFT
jgi:hypothetical protein